MKAQEFLKKLNKKNANIKKIEGQAFADCTEHDYTEEGYSDMEYWRFDDGSMLSYDGRGYLAR